MFGLLASTVVTSAADSINPIAITEQFVLQGMVKRTKDIWYFIIAIGTTNFLGGLLAYFGLISVISEFMGGVIARYGTTIYLIELVIGVAFVLSTLYLVYFGFNKKTEKEDDENKIFDKIKSVTPKSLVLLGIVATISELTTALPYFAFLSILFNYNLEFINVIFIMVVYNIVYSMPLIIMYIIYIKAKDKFDTIYLVIKTNMNKLSRVLAPAITAVIGIILISHSAFTIYL
ncbi:GAP family protein [Anaerosphaera multitolerans]|uniref:GAP family protein n=1 Tax=Anaerosphaera multitolerans TaxID=2487351 RepID=A0A437S695_9FIRM|nr:GAP family protein [Anaerosphaera multitolerans]RVU54508.1 hypothetical protein EF514_07060 [Anaerosphaera multitolerans]